MGGFLLPIDFEGHITTCILNGVLTPNSFKTYPASVASDLRAKKRWIAYYTCTIPLNYRS